MGQNQSLAWCNKKDSEEQNYDMKDEMAKEKKRQKDKKDKIKKRKEI